MRLPPKVWFRIDKLKRAWNDMFHREEPSGAAGLRMCPNCRGLIDRSASVCPLCDTPLKRAKERQVASERVLGIIPIPSTVTSILVAANIALYGVTWYMTQQAAAAAMRDAPSWGGIDGRVLVELGAKYGPLIILRGEWWRLITANFLHAGLLHIGFNLWCLVDVGPEAESLFSTSKFFVLYLVTGIFGYIVSLFWSPMGISIGASASILGLIGILIGASFHHGTLGKAYRSQLWKWVIYIFIFGLLPGFAIDNAAHLGGLVSGLALGYLVPEGEPETRTTETLWNALAILCVLAVAGSFVLMALELGQPLG